MIRRAKLSEISDILSITKACAVFMLEKGIFQWNEHYPSEAVFQNDVERAELFALLNNKQIIGAVVISTLMDKEYQPIQWLAPSKNNVYVHRLCVQPDFQGKGYAQKLMDFAEVHARENHFDSVRLDTFSQNTRNQNFYETRGYQRLGDVYFPKQREHPFHCYELVL